MNNSDKEQDKNMDKELQELEEMLKNFKCGTPNWEETIVIKSS